MEKYIVPEMEIVEFDNEDVIVTSGCEYCDMLDEGEVCLWD